MLFTSIIMNAKQNNNKKLSKVISTKLSTDDYNAMHSYDNQIRI
jgi:hypothetical protein